MIDDNQVISDKRKVKAERKTEAKLSVINPVATTVAASKPGRIQRQRVCGYCGIGVTNNWSHHWKKVHGVRSKHQMKELEPNEMPYMPFWIEEQEKQDPRCNPYVMFQKRKYAY